MVELNLRKLSSPAEPLLFVIRVDLSVTVPKSQILRIKPSLSSRRFGGLRSRCMRGFGDMACRYATPYERKSYEHKIYSRRKRWTYISALTTPAHSVACSVSDFCAVQQVVERTAFSVLHDEVHIWSFCASGIQPDDVGMLDSTQISNLNM
jgi:hypothetical protein